MTDDLREAVEKATPCPVLCGGMTEHPNVCVCEGDCIVCHEIRPSVLALVRERVAEQAFAHRGEMLELQRRMECGHPRACLTRHMQPAATDEKSCSACASVAEARRPLVESLRHEVSCVTCAEDGCSTCEDCVALILLAAEKGETG